MAGHRWYAESGSRVLAIDGGQPDKRKEVESMAVLTAAALVWFITKVSNVVKKSKKRIAY